MTTNHEAAGSTPVAVATCALRHGPETRRPITLMVTFFWHKGATCARTPRNMAQLGRALRSGRRGRGFESRYSDQSQGEKPAAIKSISNSNAGNEQTTCRFIPAIGIWPSLAGRRTGGAEVAGSSPAIPTRHDMSNASETGHEMKKLSRFFTFLLVYQYKS